MKLYQAENPLPTLFFVSKAFKVSKKVFFREGVIQFRAKLIQIWTNWSSQTSYKVVIVCGRRIMWLALQKTNHKTVYSKSSFY